MAVLSYIIFNPNQDELFRAAYEWGWEQKDPLNLKSVTLIPQWRNLVTYNLLKENPKNI